MSSNLLDRDEEIKKITQIMNVETQKNNIIIVNGISGIGKSGLVQKLAETECISKTFVFARISKNSVETIENLQYLQIIYKSLVNHLKKNKLKTKLSTANRIKRLLSQSWIYLSKIVKQIFENKTGIEGAWRPRVLPEAENIIDIKDYIIHALCNYNIVLNIQNIQNIDTRSFEVLKEILSECKSITVILEYTLGVHPTDHLVNLYNELSEDNCIIHLLEIHMMDFSIAKRLAPPNKNISIEQMKEMYIKSKGNLMEIILANEHTEESLGTTTNIAIQIENLSRTEKYILYIVYLNNGPIKYRELFEIAMVYGAEKIHIEADALDNILSQLSEMNLINCISDITTIRHDTITEFLTKKKRDYILFNAYNALKTFYITELSSTGSDEIFTEKLLPLFLDFSDSELLLAIPRVKQLLLNLKYPDILMKKLKNCRCTLSTHSGNKSNEMCPLTLMLVEVAINKKIVNEAQQNLSLIFKENNIYHILLQAQIYSLNEHENCMPKIQEIAEKMEKGSRERLICEIFLLYAMTKNCTSISARAYCEKLLSTTAYKHYMEYGYLLRNSAELYDDYSYCKCLYLDALSRFTSNHMLHEMASVHLSLAMLEAQQGNLVNAKNCIDSAQALDKRDLSICFVLNNFAILDLLERQPIDVTKTNLQNALLLVESSYEKLLIQSNLLVYYCLIKEYKYALKIALQIESTDYALFQYEEFLHIIWQNLYFFYKTFGTNNLKKEEYLNKIIGLISDENCGEYTKKLASQMNGLEANTIGFYAEFQYRVGFLGYWEFILDENLAHY